MATPVISGMFTGTANSASIGIVGPFSVTLRGTFSGTVALKRSVDDGANWDPPTVLGTGYGSFSAPCSEQFAEMCSGALYRLEGAVTSGTCTYRIDQ